MNLKKIAAATAIAFGAIASGSALAATATFTGALNVTPSYTEAGITFTSLFVGGGEHVHVGDVVPDAIYNHNGGCCTNPTRIDVGGGAFTLRLLTCS